MGTYHALALGVALTGSAPSTAEGPGYAVRSGAGIATAAPGDRVLIYTCERDPAGGRDRWRLLRPDAVVLPQPVHHGRPPTPGGEVRISGSLTRTATLRVAEARGYVVFMPVRRDIPGMYRRPEPPSPPG